MNENDRIIEAVLRLRNELSATVKQAEADVKASSATMQSHANQIGAAFTKMAGVIGVSFGAAWGVAKIKQMSQDSINLGEHITNTARKIGLTTDAYQKLGYMAKQSGADIDNMGRAFVTLAKEATKSNSIFGVSTRDVNGNVKSTSVLFQELLGRISDIKNPQERLAASMKIFGRAGLEVNAMASQGRDKLRELADETARYGLIIDGSVLHQLDEGKKAQNALGEAFKVAAANLTTWLIPAMRTYIPLLQKTLGATGIGEGKAEAASTWMSDPEKVRKVALAVREYQKIRSTELQPGISGNIDTSKEADLKQLQAQLTIQQITGQKAATIIREMATGAQQNAFMAAAARTQAAASITPASDKSIEDFLKGDKKAKIAKEMQPFSSPILDEQYKRMGEELPAGFTQQLPPGFTSESGADFGAQMQASDYKLAKEGMEKQAKEAAKQEKEEEKQQKKMLLFKKKSYEENVSDYSNMAQQIVKIGQNITNTQLNNIENQKNAETEAVEHSHMSQEQKQKKIDQINKAAIAKEKEIKKEQQVMSEVSAVISGAEAIMKGYAQGGPIIGTIEAVLMAAVTATEVAEIASQKFAMGGVVQQKFGKGGTDSEPAMLTPGEVVLRPDQLSALRGGTSTASQTTHYHLGDVVIYGTATQGAINQVRQSHMDQVRAIQKVQRMQARYRAAA